MGKSLTARDAIVRALHPFTSHRVGTGDRSQAEKAADDVLRVIGTLSLDDLASLLRDAGCDARVTGHVGTVPEAGVLVVEA